MRREPRATMTQLEVDDQIRHVRDLVFIRRLLAERGATEDELAECDAVIDEARRQLAASARRAASYPAAA